MNKFKILENIKKYLTSKNFFTHILFFLNKVVKLFNLRIPQFPQELLLLNFFLIIYFYIRKRVKNKFIEFNLRKKYIVFVKSSKFRWKLFVIKMN